MYDEVIILAKAVKINAPLHGLVRIFLDSMDTCG